MMNSVTKSLNIVTNLRKQRSKPKSLSIKTMYSAKCL